ncbi:hypothetical protein SAMN04487949_2861 [Halogranum gelatinilyticum]|uniref:DUF8163 domain-containing protein n=1 Tax=Halogranum gelatinilyticum TaxID=660521 RepID=A0A1G9X6H5_9EURY|nr:hypothetical protein [Halogranum gelatinilyticum]SDM92370.1 hypothetical protein SAMN04487949_2861 [Halogranum gelatinilyticum]
MSGTVENDVDHRSWSLPTGLEGIGLFLTVVAWGVLGGPLGLAFGIGLVVAVIALTPPFAFAVGQVLLLGVLPEAAFLEAVVAEAGLVVLLLSGFASTPRQYRFWLETVLVITLVVSIGYAAVLADVQLWIIAIVGIGLWAFVGYGLHRFELVQLELITDDS